MAKSGQNADEPARTAEVWQNPLRMLKNPLNLLNPLAWLSFPRHGRHRHLRWRARESTPPFVPLAQKALLGEHVLALCCNNTQ